MAISPLFVLRGFSAEPSACCGCSTSNKAFLVLGLADGSLELWNMTTFRSTWRSNGPIFPSQSPVLCVRQLAGATIAAESKLHEMAFFKIAPPDNLVNTFNINVTPDTIAPSFCQFDSVKVDNSINLIARSGQESSLVITEISSESSQKDTDLAGPQSLGKLGLVMFVKLILSGKNVRIVCGFESSHVVLWSLNQDMTFALLENLQLTSLFDKSKEQDDMDMCPTCADSACPTDEDSGGKSVSLIVGSTSNAIFKLAFNDDLTSFAASLGRTPSKGITAVRIRPSDRKLAAVGFSDGSICLVSPKSLSVLGTLSHHRLQPSPSASRTISSLDFVHTLDSKWILAASSRDRTVSLWDIYNKS